MAPAGAVREARDLVAQVERLLEEADALSDPHARAFAGRLVHGVVDLYGAGLGRMVEMMADHDTDGTLAAAVAGDELVSHLLVLHGLHPVGLEQRVAEALAEVRPYLESHGGDVELLAIEGEAVRLRLSGSCRGCPSSAATLRLAIENAIHRYAPEIEDVVADEATAPQPLLQIEVAPGRGRGTWTVVGGLRDLVAGRPLVKRVAGEGLVFLRLGQRTYCYRDGCPACGASLHHGRLDRVALVCPGCGEHFDAVRAGRGLDSPQLTLDPVPLLLGEDGLVRVAMEVAA